ncbi:DnaA N-terminal domain-containing protein [Archangium lipolyticum]|uniref:DnaA N-terminal domain-containing protein n=1 Tax=Archangium lipolyticum TaxID=2970465 RepID=UPI002149A92E|nr:DnaA N-terminal domain-containing protein [Archangium lipolyticum]
MAGLDWVQVDVGFPMSLAVVCAARTLGMERRAFLGAMVELQIWAVQALPSGRFEPFAASAGHAPDASADEDVWREAVESAVRWTGTPGAFWNALLRAGILVREDDSVRLTLCDRYVQVLEKRRKEAERKRRERANKASTASAGRPADAPGTSSARKRREKESEKKTLSTAAGAESSVSAGRLAPVPLLPDEDVSADVTPVQLSLPGTHLVPVTPPPEERHPLTATTAPEPQDTPAQQAAAFFESFQDERSKAFRGVPREDMPAGWADWYAKALSKVGGDEERLLAACRGYLKSDWGRSRQPVCTALAFCSPKVWVRYIPPQQSEPAEESGPPSVDVTTEAGRTWQECLTRLHDQGKHYALTWLTRARPLDVRDGHLMLAVPDLYFRQWVEEHYGQTVELLVRDFGLLGVRWVLPAQAAGAER